MEQIYTIPVNEAFDACLGEAVDSGSAEQKKSSCHCPICRLYEKLNGNELERILGAAMMEPDVRIETNREGFCPSHFRAMFGKKNRLGLALMLESHLDELRSDLQPSAIGTLIKGVGTATAARTEKLESDCYLCRRIEEHFGRMIQTVLYLYRTDEGFRRKFEKQPFFCLPHFRRLNKEAKNAFSKKLYADFYRDTEKILLSALDSLCEDVSWFCKKFDYRYENEPWYNAKDAVERAIAFLSSSEALHP